MRQYTLTKCYEIVGCVFEELKLSYGWTPEQIKELDQKIGIRQGVGDEENT